MEHSDRIAQEISFFKEMDLNALPEIYCYWSNRHLIHFIHEAFGSYDLFEIFARELGESVTLTGNPTIISIGAGDAEIDQIIALRMLDLGYTNFHFQCLELSTFLIDRAKERMKGSPAAAHFTFVEVDLSNWKPQRPFGACFAHHSLHHIVALEHVFDQIKLNLAPRGSFLTSDMIGRNGHMRWPETLAIIDAIWSAIPDAWKHNRPLKRFEKKYVNWDCSTHGFEGVRAQDILPLLVERFHFHRFSAWGGILDPFIDRAFGHNLKSTVDYDREFVDALWEANKKLVKLGSIKPTQIIAVMKNEAGSLVSSDQLEPAACVRPPDKINESKPTVVANVGMEAASPSGESAGSLIPTLPDRSLFTRLRGRLTRLFGHKPSVTHPGQLALSGAQSGSWYDPGRAGEGFQLEIGKLGNARQIIVSWHTYSDRKQVWLTGNAELPPNSVHVTIPMVITSGANFGSEFRPGDVTVEQWGSLTFNLIDAMRMHVTYTPTNGRGGFMDVERLLDCIEGLPCR